MQFPDGTTNAEDRKDLPRIFSVCTLVTDLGLYSDSIASFRANGFDNETTEFLYIDNTKENRFDAFSGLNLLISRSTGKYLILAHQDVLLFENRETLLTRLDELETLDPSWAVAGNAGRNADRSSACHITDVAGIERRVGKLPMKVTSLDENFLILKRDANLGFSADLSGYHMYGSDIVLLAEIQGWTAYVFDFHLEHWGLAVMGAPFEKSQRQFESKYLRAMRPRVIRTTVTQTYAGRLDPYQRLRAWHRKNRQKSEQFAGTKQEKIKAFLFRVREVFSGPFYKIGGQRIRIPRNTSVAAQVAIWRGLYEKPERDLVEAHLERGQTVIELGGSFGVVSGLVRKLIGPEGRHVIVEANPALLEYCRENGIPQQCAAQSTLTNAAISYSGESTVTFQVTEGIHDSRLAENGQSENTTTVRGLTLSDLLRENNVDGSYVLVCDIEGTEYDILMNDRDALTNCICAIIELHPHLFYRKGRTVAAFLEMFASAGFKVVETAGNVLVGKK